MKKQIAIVFLCSVMMLSLASATYANYYYRDDCSHCNAIKNYILDLDKQFEIRWKNVYEGSYNVQATPTAEVITSDDRKIILVGSNQISKNLGCELNEVSDMNCVTRSASEGVDSNTNSWFIR